MLLSPLVSLRAPPPPGWDEKHPTGDGAERDVWGTALSLSLRGHTAHSRYLCPGASSAAARDLTRFLRGPAGMGLGGGEGGTGASQGQGQHWGHRRVSQHCPTPHPLSPRHRPLISVRRTWNLHHPLPLPTALGTVASDSTQQGTAPRAGTVALTWPGAAVTGRVRAQRPRHGAGLAWPAGMAQRGRRKRREGWSCSQEVWTWSQLRKRKKKNLKAS